MAKKKPQNLTPDELAADIPVDPGAYEIIARAPQMRELQALEEAPA